ncbi:MAG: NADH-quinone oxidoreductase subunit C [Acidimicrobiia bacterium]|nr:NADH-quinone oxidoreductase subunit C [Acidimicrobiia bacterium]MCY4433087.1 NADH-quinone oxidoreductase subunit C [bacterium]
MTQLSSTEIETDAAAESGPPPDERREAWAAQLAAELGEGFVEHHVIPGSDLWVRVARDSWTDAATAARDQLGCQFFDWLSSIDWLPSPYGRDMDAQEDNPQAKAADPMEQGHAGGHTRFQMVVRLYSLTEQMGITIKADLPADDLSIDSLIEVYAGANWHEREAWEMFGIHFNNHPDLRHIYLPGEFEGNPLRKDFPLLARRVKPWPGIVDVELFPGEEGS